VRRRLTSGFCACIMGALVLGGCSSKGSVADSGTSDTSIADTAPSTPGIDAGCDDSAAGISYCIINPPGPALGGGTVVTRLNPTPFQQCKY